MTLCYNLPVKLDRLPAAHIIRGFRGVLDFYVDHGQPRVRRWPQNKHAGYTPGGNYNRTLFARANTFASQAAPNVRHALSLNVGGTGYTWKDLYVHSYLGGSPLTHKRPSYPTETLPDDDPDPALWTLPSYILYGTTTGYSWKGEHGSPPDPGPLEWFLHIIHPGYLQLQLFWWTGTPQVFNPLKVTRGVTATCGVDYLPGTGLHTAAMTTTKWAGGPLWQNYVRAGVTLYLPVGFFFFFCPRYSNPAGLSKSLSPVYYYDPRIHFLAPFTPPPVYYRANPITGFGPKSHWTWLPEFNSYVPDHQPYDPNAEVGLPSP